MANFDELERAMRDWVEAAITSLNAGAGPVTRTTLRSWRRDEDAVFRDREREVQTWDHADVEAAQRLPSWQAVIDALYRDDRLRPHVDTLVGSGYGARRFDADQAGRIVLPMPHELDDVDAAFARQYAQLEAFLAADEIERTVVWPIPGLTSSEFPIVLETGVELDLMSDEELAASLDTQVLPLMFPNLPILPPNEPAPSCLRHRYRVPKLIGDFDAQGPGQVQATEERLQEIATTLEQVLALLYADPVALSGRVAINREWTWLFGGIAFQAFPLTRAQQFRRLELDPQSTSEVVDCWQRMRQPALLERHQAMSLALRRLAYQASRERIEDELVDLLVASEALYLSDMGYEELGFRLALRASALSDSNRLDLTRREVFNLMKSAYRVRSKIVHGESPKPSDLKLKGAQATLADFVQAIEDVIRDGLRTALGRAADPTVAWPPDWDELTLPKG